MSESDNAQATRADGDKWWKRATESLERAQRAEAEVARLTAENEKLMVERDAAFAHIEELKLSFDEMRSNSPAMDE